MRIHLRRPTADTLSPFCLPLRTLCAFAPLRLEVGGAGCEQGIPGLIMRAHAAVAQLVEQRIRNAKVASSTPASGTIQEHLQAGPRPESQVLFALCRIWI